MRNFIISFAIVFASILNLFAQDTLITNVRSITKNGEDINKRIDYKIVVDTNFTKVTFIGSKKNPTFEIQLISLEEKVSDGFGTIMKFKTNGKDKVNIFFEGENMSIVSIEQSPSNETYYLFSNISKNFEKVK
jgi:hypothetical protein